ncbi:hypothetical protein K469DRAFT_734242 [Zopfia rhizophila CBS 207.26]|uniref:Tetratricopeptide SHNi-TPR domain-containing protein n=1 Tax=Zopfia rhizophila CBS 207.26 TaxID=1314779 RepID=A0A6A6EUI5_9PEZI|nr:hypothetical protein K469DRAFT_734242 [Zopfia rhizophila CBS 207.26]
MMAAPAAEPTSSAAEASPTKEKLSELTTAAALQYSLKNFTDAANLYSEATAVQAELNGEMAPENAELLYSYGRCLYKVAIAKSDVLGGKVAQEEKKKPEKKARKEGAEASASGSGQLNGTATENKEATVESKPFFQLTGDENWTDSEDEEEGEGGEGAAEEAEEDDFSNAYEILDFARVLLSRQLETLQTAESGDKGKGKAEDTLEAKKIKERLADTHDLLGEISLENERFHDAVSDSRAALEYRKQLLPFEDALVTEAHYKLSLALEFASMTQVREAEREAEAATSTNKSEEQEAKVDMELRKQAAEEMEQAISSLESRLGKEQADLPSLPEDKKEATKKSIAEVKDMLEEMRQRLIDLRADPTKQQFNPAEGIDPSVFSGLLGGLLGTDPATQKAKIEEATKSAKDVTGLVRTKKKEKAPEPAASGNGSGKRKLEIEDDGMNGKRAKTEEMQ